MRRSRQLRVAACLAAALCAATGPGSAVAAQDRPATPDGDLPTPGRMEAAPEELRNVGIDEHLDAVLPLDAAFVDETGRDVTLGDYFGRDKPVVLALVYYRCPMLCNLILDGLTSSMKELEWTAGGEFDVVAVSFDPTETPKLAGIKRQAYLKQYGRPEGDAGMHFLTTSSQATIDRLTDTVGFRYTFVEDRNEYAHTAALFLITPDGRISKYLYGIVYDPRTLRLALVEAGEGKVGTIVDRVLLYCFHYDADEGKYSLVARQVMKLGGGVMVVVLGLTLFVFWRREVGRARDDRSQPKGTES